MRTNNIYYGILYRSKSIDYEGYYRTTKGVPIRRVLVLKKVDTKGKTYLKDLNRFSKYSLIIPFEIGKLYVDPETLEKFNDINNNIKNNLSKSKIKKMAKNVLSKEI